MIFITWPKDRTLQSNFSSTLKTFYESEFVVVGVVIVVVAASWLLAGSQVCIRSCLF